MTVCSQVALNQNVLFVSLQKSVILCVLVKGICDENNL